MVKCPFCNFENEDGALFCEQCKSDLSAVEPTPMAADETIPVATAEEAPEAAVVDDTVPIEAEPVEAEPVEAEAVAEAEPIEAEPVEAEPVAEAEPIEAAPVEAEPVEAEPVAEAAPVEEAPAAAEPEPEPAPAPAPEPAPAAAAAPAPAAAQTSVPAGSSPVLVVIRGQKVNTEFPIYGDLNFVGRSDDKPVDIDLDDQEPPDRVWSSRQHAVINFDEAACILTIEDLNSANGTFVNRSKIYPGEKKQLFVNDVIQIGTVHLKLKA